MSNEKPELLKCPFCGKEPRYVPADYVDNHGQPWPFAECDPCNVGAPVEFWNRRAGSIVLPSRKSVESGPHYSVNSASEYGYLAGWNACLDEAFAEQPAPVAFPGYPVVPEDRKLPADAGGYGDDAPCPECGSRDCNGQCFGDDMMGDS